MVYKDSKDLLPTSVKKNIFLLSLILSLYINAQNTIIFKKQYYIVKLITFIKKYPKTTINTAIIIGIPILFLIKRKINTYYLFKNLKSEKNHYNVIKIYMKNIAQTKAYKTLFWKNFIATIRFFWQTSSVENQQNNAKLIHAYQNIFNFIKSLEMGTFELAEKPKEKKNLMFNPIIDGKPFLKKNINNEHLTKIKKLIESLTTIKPYVIQRIQDNITTSTRILEELLQTKKDNTEQNNTKKADNSKEGIVLLLTFLQTQITGQIPSLNMFANN